MPIGPEHRTRAYSDTFENALIRTNAGMASFAVPGSPHRCGRCLYWLEEAQGGKGRCAAYTRLMRGRKGALVAASQTACKMFEAARR